MRNHSGYHISKNSVLLIKQFCFYLLLLCFFTSAAVSAHQVPISFSLQEQKFIDSHSEVVLGSDLEFEPFFIKKASGDITGHDAEILQLISERTGLNIRVELGVWSDIQRKAKNGRLDGLATAIFDKSRLQWFIPSYPYITMSSLVLVRNGNPLKIYSKSDLKGKRIALQRGNLLFDKLWRKFAPAAEPVYYNTMPEIVQALSSGEVDFTIMDESVLYLSRKVGLAGTIEGVFSVGKPFELILFLNKEQPELQSIINKGLNSISEQERIDIRNRWFKQEVAGVNSKSQFKLTDAEKEYLTFKGKLNICVNSSWMPLEQMNEYQYTGIAADFFTIFAKRLDIHFEFQTSKNWNDSRNALKNHRCDLISLFEASDKHSDSLTFTAPYAASYYTLATQNKHAYVNGFKGNINKKYAIHHGRILLKKLQNRYPNLDIVEVENAESGIRLVSSGEIFAYIDTPEIINYTLKEMNISNVKINGQLPQKLELSLAMRSDENLLRSIFQKAVNSVDHEERQRIYNKWFTIEVKKIINYKLLVYISLGFISFLIIFSYCNRRLRRAKKETEQALFEIKNIKLDLERKNTLLQKLSVTDKLTQLFNRNKLDQVLLDMIKHNQRTPKNDGVIIIDIDSFKSINDTYGHPVGDEVLVNTAMVIQKSMREIDVVGRWGGEEFLLICSDINAHGLYELAERIRKNVENSSFIPNKTITISIGATLLTSVDDHRSILCRADKALYQAKENGRNRCIVI